MSAVIAAGSGCSNQDYLLDLPAQDAPGPALRGISYTSWRLGQYAASSATASLDQLASTSASTLSLLVTWYQSTATATQMARDPFLTPSDSDLRYAIDQAHLRGLAVLLVPHVDLSSDPTRRRSDIGRSFDEASWQTWFGAYRDFLLYYAALAQSAGVEALSVGTELTASERRGASWRALIAEVRTVFSGPLVYGCNWDPGPEVVQWWDALDWIGVDAYYPLDDAAHPRMDTLVRAWLERGHVARLREIATLTQRPIVLTEIGYRSIEGAASRPYDYSYDAPLDLGAQATAYQAALRVFWGQPWLRGLVWWNWSPSARSGGANDDDYTPRGKSAETVVRDTFMRP